MTYGVVQIGTTDDYKLVCADDFDDVAARVVCQSAGFHHGISVCCSAFGDMKYDIGYCNHKCSGDESSILNCTRSIAASDCVSGKYASVACSDQPASGGTCPPIFFLLS